MAMYSVIDRPDDRASRKWDASERDSGFFGVDRPGVAWDWMAQMAQPPEGFDWVRPQVVEAWRRCIEDYGLLPRKSLLDPHVKPRFERGEETTLATSLDVRTALATMAFNLQPMLRDTSVSLLLADAEGALFHIMDAGIHLGPLGRRFVRLGESWNERAIGNNGLGTSAVALEPVAFDGKEHFAAALHPFATVGYPLLAHDGKLVASLGLMTDQRSSAQALLGFVRMAGCLMEAELFERHAPGPITLRLRSSGLGSGLVGQDGLLNGLISLDDHGLIVGATHLAVDLLRAARHFDIMQRPIETLLGQNVAELLASARGGASFEVETSAGWRLKVESAVAHPQNSVELQGSRDRPMVTASEKALAWGTPAQFSGSRRSRQRGQVEPWRDAVLETALRKAVSLQKQKIPILITGESGVGKDHLVRMSHASGPRQGRPLVLVNCAAIPRDLISTELFGYVPGSFTGASSAGKPGKFLEAHGGVLFLDEIGDMAVDLQTAFLCALDNSEIVPVGGSKPIAFDVQIVAATNSNLLDCVRNGTFRRDLYYRLNGTQLWLPPLRERPDKLGLIEHLWSQELRAQGMVEPTTLSPDVWDIFERHPWPGNIRELRNVLRSCLAMTIGEVTRASDLPIDFIEEMSDSNLDAPKEGDPPQLATARPSAEPKALVDWEVEAIRSALTTSGGNISKSARKLGITRATLYHKMERHGLRK